MPLSTLRGVFSTFWGRAMGYRVQAAIAVTIGLAALAAGPSLADGCRLNKLTSIPVTFEPDGRMLLDGAINGDPVKLLLYTGSPRTLLEPGYVKSHNLPWQDDNRIQGYGLTGKALSGFARIDQITLGDFRYGVQNVAFSNLGGVPGNPVGLISNDLLEAYDVEIDPAAGKVNMFSPDHCKGQVVYWANEYSKLPLFLNKIYQPEIEVQVNGETLRARIDTGMPITTMRLAVARRLFGISDAPADAKSHSTITGTDGVALDSFAHSFDSLTLGDITLRNTSMQIADIDVAHDAINTGTHMSGAVRQPDVYIGMSLLRKLHTFIVYSEPAFYFTVADTPKAK